MFHLFACIFHAQKRGAARRLGLVVALACAGTQACLALNADSRDVWQLPDRVVRTLGLPAGAKVADLGAGYGYFSFRLADAVGPEGRVYAVELSKKRVAALEKDARAGKRANVRVIQATESSPGLPEPVDLIFLCNVYHHLENRTAYFRARRADLKPGGRVAIIDYSVKGERYAGHSVAEDVVLGEMRAAGYRLRERPRFLSKQNFFIFVPIAP